MPNANGGVCISYTLGKRSQLVISDPLDRFTSDTGVASVVDAANSLTWTIKKFVLKKKRLRVVIEGTRPPTTPVAAGAAPAAAGPDCGDITITLNDAGGATPPTVNTLPVDYIDDNT